MKQVLSILSLIILLYSCGNKNSKSDSTEESKPFKVAEISGEWAKSGYKDDLIKSQSPIKSGRILSGNTGVCIGNAVNDSAFVLILINNHEAITGYISNKKPGKEPNSLNFISDSPSDETIDFKVEKNDNISTLVLTTYDNLGNELCEDRFDYVSEAKDINDPCGLTAINVLVLGNWTITDSSNNNVCDISINKYGEIKGWKDYNTFSILTDVIMGDKENEIRLSSSEMYSGINYIAEFNGNVISLFEALPCDTLPYNIRGKLLLTMTRKS